MSFGSPAKLERIERHLSRQRGAGVRSLATSFGFSLGLPAATVLQDASSEGPAAKRRKLSNVCNGLVIPTAATKEQGSEKAELMLHNECEQNAPTTTKLKARRRFEAMDDERKQQDLDDSFTKTAKKRGRSKKGEIAVKTAPVKATKKPTKARTKRKAKEDVPEERHDVEKSTDVGVEKPVRRPRRQAATSAMAKVTEGFVEEAAPIDMKRREPEPEKVVKRGRKKAVPVIAVQEVVEVAAETQEAVTIDEKRRRPEPEPEKVVKREQNKAVPVTAQKVVAVSVDNQDGEPSDRSHETGDERPAKRSRKKGAAILKPDEPVTSNPAHADAMGIEPVASIASRNSANFGKPIASSKAVSKLQVKDGTIFEPADMDEEPKIKKQRRKAKAEASPSTLAPDSTSHKSVRKPLGETHANTAMRSTSPKKMSKSPAKHEDEVKEYVSVPKSHGTSPAKAHTVFDAPVKKRKAAKPFTDPILLQDIAVDKEDFGAKTKAREKDERLAEEALQEETVLTNPSRSVKSARAAAVSSKPPTSGPELGPLEMLPAQEHTNLQPLSKKKPAKATSSKTRSRAAQPPAVADDDDNVDWLLTAPGDVTRLSRSQRTKKQKIAARAPSSRSKMAIDEDMDLDDLLSNIATFAGAMATGKSQKSTRRAM
ncbi:unnamed protein product [Zymoseptoria tritici ST99CH_1A5]|uniref:Uncharacterized protein n=1 Tax=Zymoseptoria tritici ST99CH_1A5 TaxID=1276529 RepID=A0A1Y6L554_ZYMTR|nr:unnamed protein product [Zymoseptoria tritici ST99CH_1A5]